MTVQRFKPYAAYKDSGVEWLGGIPAHWEVKRLKFLLAQPLKYGANEAAELDDPELPRYVRITDIDESDSLREDTFKSLPVDVAEEYLLREGDLLFARSGATAGKTFLYRRNWGTCAYAGYLIRARLDTTRACPEFVRYFTASSSYWQWLSTAFIQATIQNVSAEKYASLVMSHPSYPEQHTIAAFLDRETARIDALVAKKERLIELLQEKRTALITRTVIKGLDPTAPMKDSDVEWLGEIPAHWEVRPFAKYVVEKSDYRGKTPEKVASGVFLVTARNVRMGLIDYDCSQEFIAEEDYDEVMRRGVPRKGDVLFTTEAPLGNVALVDREGIALAQRIIRFRMNPDHFDSRFTLFAMMSDYFQGQLLTLSTGSTAEGLKASKLPMLRLVAPPVTEQYAIAAFLDQETARIDALVAKVRDAIDRLKELRTALISAAVTGKIDVREAVA